MPTAPSDINIFYEFQFSLLKTIIANPSETLPTLSSELDITVHQIRCQRKQIEYQARFLCRKGANKRDTSKIKKIKILRSRTLNTNSNN